MLAGQVRARCELSADPGSESRLVKPPKWHPNTSPEPLTFAQYNVTDTQVNVLKACLVDGTLTPAEAAEQLTTYAEASPTPLVMQQRLAGLWSLLNDTAVDVPSSQPRIVSMSQSIRTLPEIDVPRGEGEGVFDLDDGFVWRELTEWVNDWADNFNQHGANFPSKSAQAVNSVQLAGKPGLVQTSSRHVSLQRVMFPCCTE